jgi:hypothetical protein
LIETREHFVVNYKLKNTYWGQFVAMYREEKTAVSFKCTHEREREREREREGRGAKKLNMDSYIN